MKKDKTFLITHVNDKSELEKVLKEQGFDVDVVTSPSNKDTFYLTNEEQFERAIIFAKEYMLENELDGSWVTMDNSMEYGIHETPIAIGTINPAYIDKTYNTGQYRLFDCKFNQIIDLVEPDDILVYINEEIGEAIYITTLFYEEGLQKFKKKLLKINSPFDTLHEVSKTGKVLTKTYISKRN